jgi:GNAT superfamily N-acetyltransferase
MPLSDAQLAEEAQVPVEIVAPIRTIESGGNARAFRFETRLFRERTGRTLEGHTRSVFNQAYAINPQAAVESSSFGLYQQLGSTLLRIYSTPSAALAAFDRDPVHVSQRLFVRYFHDRDVLREAAQRRDWAALAHMYNGCNVSGANGPAGCRWYARFMELVGAPGGAVVAGGAGIGIGLLALAAFAAWRMSRGPRGLGDMEYEVAPRQGRRPAVCPRIKIHVEESRYKVNYEVVARAYTLDDDKLGEVQAWQKKPGGNLAIGWSSVIDGGDRLTADKDSRDYSGCGIGTRLYEAVAKAACKQGIGLESDTYLKPASFAFWKKQEAKGRARWDGEDRSLFEPGDDRQAQGRFVLHDACGARDLGLFRR